MKSLQRAEGPRDCTIVEVVIHLASLQYQYRNYRQIYDDPKFSHISRVEALDKMRRLKEMILSWREVKKDIIKKSKQKREVIV